MHCRIREGLRLSIYGFCGTGRSRFQAERKKKLVGTKSQESEVCTGDFAKGCAFPFMVFAGPDARGSRRSGRLSKFHQAVS